MKVVVPTTCIGCSKVLFNLDIYGPLLVFGELCKVQETIITGWIPFQLHSYYVDRGFQRLQIFADPNFCGSVVH